MEDHDVRKPFWKSKNVLTACSMFILSFLTLLQTFDLSPRVMAAVGVVFSTVWIILRCMTDEPITPTINLPDIRRKN